MIGDSFFDMKCANNAGVKTVLVGWRATGKGQTMDGCRVDYTIEKPMDLIRILEVM